MGMPRKASIPPDTPRKKRKFVPKRKPKYTYEQVEAALLECKGRTYTTAEKLDINVSTLYDYFKRYPKLYKLLKQVKKKTRHHRIYKAEDMLDKLVARGDFAAIKYILSTLAKSWGYTFKRVVEHIKNADEEGKRDIPQISEEVKKKLLADAIERNKQRKLLEQQQRPEIGLKELPASVQEAEVMEPPRA